MSNLFDQEQETQQPAQAPTDTGPATVLVGEGRKYRSNDDLATAYIAADDHISKLQEENKTLRDAATKASTVEDVLKRIEDAKRLPAETQQAPAQQGLSEQDVSRIVESTVTSRETTKTREANRATANAEMFKLYGDKAGEIFNAKATTKEQRTALTHLAEVSPEQFVALFNTSAPAPQSSNMAPGQNTAGQEHIAKDTSDEPGTKAFYNKMRRENPKLYYARDTQIAMLTAADENRDKYFGR